MLYSRLTPSPFCICPILYSVTVIIQICSSFVGRNSDITTRDWLLTFNFIACFLLVCSCAIGTRFCGQRSRIAEFEYTTIANRMFIIVDNCVSDSKGKVIYMFNLQKSVVRKVYKCPVLDWYEQISWYYDDTFRMVTVGQTSHLLVQFQQFCIWNLNLRPLPQFIGGNSLISYTF
jgi:hypothetical protein